MNVEFLHRSTATDLATLRITHDPSNASHWCHMHASQAFSDAAYRPCFSPRLLRELRLFAREAIEGCQAASAAAEGPAPALSHIVIGSDAHVFNLGGDLDLFAGLIRQRDRDGLLRYATECVDSIHLLHTRLHPDAHTVALVQGDALGGGFEAALSCQTIVAEEGVGMGLPEVLFGLFPGMGAYSFLCKRVTARQAEKMILSGEVYSSEEMYRLGVVDVLVPKGQGESAVQDLIRQHQRAPHSHLAMNAVRKIGQPVSYEELMGITEVWVDTALALGEKSLRTMERIVRAQARRASSEAA
jgi:DSF synthase